MVPHISTGASSSPAHSAAQSSLALECLLAGAILIVLLSLWERRTLAFWSWGLYSPLVRDKVTTTVLFVVQAGVITALTSILPILSHAFGVVPTGNLGKGFLIAEAVTAGAALVAGIRVARSHAETDDGEMRGLLQRAGLGALEGLGERAGDSAMRVLTHVLERDETRQALLRRLRLVLAQHDPNSTVDLVIRNVADGWSSLTSDQQDFIVEELALYVVRHRIPPHRLLR